MTPLLVWTMQSEKRVKGAEGRGGVARLRGQWGGSAPGNSVWKEVDEAGGWWSQTNSQQWQCLSVEEKVQH